MTSAKWTFVLAQSRNLVNIAPLTQARSRSINLTLNRPGSLSFTLPMTDDLASLINPLSSAIKAYRKGSNQTQLIWSGYVSTIDEDISANRMTVNCIGWFERLNKRFIRSKLTYTNQDDGAIISSLMTNATGIAGIMSDGYVASIPPSSSPNNPLWMAYGGTRPNEGIGGATAYQPLTNVGLFGVNAPRNKTYEIGTSIGSSITELSDLESGVDFEIDPATRLLYVFRKKMSDLPSVVFGYNWGPNNISQFSRQIDSSTVVNYHVSSGRAGLVPQFAHDTTSQQSYGLIEESANLSEVKEQSILFQYSGAEVFFRSQPRITYSLTPFPWSENSRVPEPFTDYDIGDKVYLTAQWGERINIQDQAVRVFGMNFSIDEEGNERPGPLQVSPG